MDTNNGVVIAARGGGRREEGIGSINNNGKIQ